MRQDFGGGGEIAFERIGKAGVVTLTRPKALNALTHTMVLALGRAMDAWEPDESIALVILRGEGRAFCAGGDILHVYEQGRAGNPPVGFFADEYRLNARIARFPKPWVSLIDGIVMGGGVGLSFHGSHRVMTGNALFAMPEVGIGFFPDVGGSYILPRLKGEFGLFLGLTGQRIRRGDALWSGLATHCVEADALPALFDALCADGDPAAALKPHAVDVPRETDEASIHAINRHFAPAGIEGVIASLEAGGGDEGFSERTLAAIRARSPTSVAVAFRQIRAGRMLSMPECMVMEFRILNRMLAGHDFYEGIRAVLVDKGSTPVWSPSRLEDVTEGEVEAYFAALPGGELAP